MKEWKVLVTLEYEWRVFRYYRKIVNWLVKRGVKLSSPLLCYMNRKMDKHCMMIPGLKKRYENQTGKILVFYKCDDY